MIGQTISHYKILEKLGQGGMGVVYKAQDTKLDRIVALKFLPSQFAVDATERIHFLQEARAASALNHPNVCHINAIEEHEGQQFIDMEFVDGLRLRDLIPIANLEDALAYAIQISEALTEAHSKGIVHRDVKPENIMVTREGRIKVMDFGLAKLKGGGKLTRVGLTVGTITYMSPEQAQGNIVDHRTDIWSLGIVLYEMVAGEAPFRGDYDQAIIYQVLNTEPKPLSSHRPDVPARYEQIVMKALRKNPAERYQQAADVFTDLKRTSTGERSASIAASTVKQPFVRRRSTRTSAAAIVLLAAGIGVYLIWGRGAEPLDSIAVLPFVNAAGDSTAEYISDGVTEGLINSLSQFPNLKVMSRSAVFRFKGGAADPQEVGRALHVRAVLTGRLAQRGEDLSVNAELVDVADNSHLWGEQYRMNSLDLLTIEERISKAIFMNLRLRLSGEEDQRLRKRLTDNPEAYKSYLKGRYHWNKRTKEGLATSIQFYTAALEQDPTYALAYSGLAEAYGLLNVYGISPARESFPKAEAAAHRALEIDETVADAHTALAYAHFQFDWDWNAAEREFRRGLELNPNSSTGHHWYAEYLIFMGRGDQAMVEISRAQSLDPLSLIIGTDKGWFYYLMHKSDSALAQLHKVVELDSNFWSAHFCLGETFEQQGLYNKAIGEYERAVSLARGGPPLMGLGRSYALSGRKEDARRIIKQMLSSGDPDVQSAGLAIVEAALGENKTALDWLDKAYEAKHVVISYMKIHPFFDPLRNEPRFQAMMRKIGFLD